MAGGGFYVVLPRGTAPPARRQLAFTTTSDAQTVADVRVCAERPRQGGGRPGEKELVVLDEFELAGLAPAAVGAPQLGVAFELSTDWQLHVTVSAGGASHTSSVLLREGALGKALKAARS